MTMSPGAAASLIVTSTSTPATPEGESEPITWATWTSFSFGGQITHRSAGRPATPGGVRSILTVSVRAGLAVAESIDGEVGDLVRTLGAEGGQHELLPWVDDRLGRQGAIGAR